MKILAINCGSTSLKFKLFDGDINFLAGGIIEKIGEKKSIFSYKSGGKNIADKINVKNHEQGLKLVIRYLLDKDLGVVKNIKDIKAIGHRVVHGGNIASTKVVTPAVIKQIQKNTKLAPLHNPANLAGIKICGKLFPRARQIAVFDTAFHQTMPEKNFIYPLPYKFFENYGIRKYGFHGISHHYLTLRAATLLKKPKSKINLIICHLGAGCSMAAIKNGKSYDTSMGFTPTAGLMMSTRAGDIDPGIIIYLIKSLGISALDAENILNYQSGLLGISGLSRDMRKILAQKDKNKKSKLALDMFIDRVKKYIGSYIAELPKIDALVFSGGIGARSHVVRGMICEDLKKFGIIIDSAKNKKSQDEENIISTRGSDIKILAITTDEEKMIALEAKKLA